ncbi:MAG: hypothetical protein ACM3KM_00255 [Acidobacteriaceae bacterium]
MNQVIKNILFRRNISVPVNDGRKIVMVLNGGLMASIAGAAVLKAMAKLGLTRAFDVIYSASMGFANGLYFLSEDMDKCTDLYLNGLADKKFINLLRFWKPADINYGRVLFYGKSRPNVEKMFANKTKLMLRLHNLTKKRIEYVDALEAGIDQYQTLMNAAASMKYFGQGPVEYKGDKYIDGQFTGFFVKDTRDFLQETINSDATDILVIYSRRTQTKALDLKNSERVFQIFPDPDHDLFNFEINKDKLIRACAYMEEQVQRLFLAEERLLQKREAVSA